MISNADWEGEGWYTFRVWIHTNGIFTVEDWKSPEAPKARWIENIDEYGNSVLTPGWPERTTIVDYYGAEKWPDTLVDVAEEYCGLPGFDEWYRTMANQTD